MTGGDLSAELVDKDNPNLLLSFVTDTNVVQESGINSLHSFLTVNLQEEYHYTIKIILNMDLIMRKDYI